VRLAGAMGKKGHGTGPCVERGGDMKKKKSRLALGKFGPKELREFRKGFLISRSWGLNEIRSNSNKVYSKHNSRAYINTGINASRHECSNQL
jgi:hypothetical protein